MVRPADPLRHAGFRLLWLGSVSANTGTWMQSVGAAWLMTELTRSPLLVALVQSATTLPTFLVALPAGVLADIGDDNFARAGVRERHPERVINVGIREQLMIGVAATLFAIVSRERPLSAVGAPKVDVAANLAASNSAAPVDTATSEPLAEMGVAPAASPTPNKP